MNESSDEELIESILETNEIITRKDNTSPHRKNMSSYRKDSNSSDTDCVPSSMDEINMEDKESIESILETKEIINRKDNTSPHRKDNISPYRKNSNSPDIECIPNLMDEINLDSNKIKKVKENKKTKNQNLIINKDITFTENIENIVFSGGGIKGFAFLGVLKYLNENDLIKNITTFAGTSIGSVFALAMTLGYTADEIFRIFTEMNLEQVNNITSDNIFNFFDVYGIDNGNNVERIIEIIIKAKVKDSKINFLDLFNKTQKHLIVNATDLNAKQNKIFDYKNTPDFCVYQAIRMSISIPFFFFFVKFDNKLYIDGGCVNNFIIDLFKDKSKNTLGFLLRNKDILESKDNISTYFSNVLNCLMDYNISVDKEYYNVIEIYTDIHFLKLDINENEKDNLIKIGYEETKIFFEKK